MTVRMTYRLQDAFECDLAATDDGWAMAAVCMEDVDEGFIANMDADREWEDIKAILLPGVTYQGWIDAYLAMRPTLHLVESRSGGVRVLHTSTAEQFSGFAVASGPAFAWTELDGDTWSLKLHRDGETSTLESGSTVLQDPSVTRDGDGVLWIGWVSPGGLRGHGASDRRDGRQGLPASRPSPQPGSRARRHRGVLRAVPGRRVARLLLEAVAGGRGRASPALATQPAELPAALHVGRRRESAGALGIVARLGV